MGVPPDVPAKGGGILPEVGGPIYLITGLRNGFAAFKGFDQRELFFLLQYKLPRLEQNLHAFCSRSMWPGAFVEGASRCSDSGIDVCGIGLRVLSNERSVCRAFALKFLSRYGRHFLAVDPQLTVKGCFWNHVFSGLQILGDVFLGMLLSLLWRRR